MGVVPRGGRRGGRRGQGQCKEWKDGLCFVPARQGHKGGFSAKILCARPIKVLKIRIKAATIQTAETFGSRSMSGPQNRCLTQTFQLAEPFFLETTTRNNNKLTKKKNNEFASLHMIIAVT